MIYYIYKITCTKGTFKDHFYYGKHQTNNIDDGYKGSGKLLKNYYKKYPNDYIKEIISYHNSLEELNNAEKLILSQYLDNKLCLNIQIGGTGGDNYTYLSEEEKEIRRKKLKNGCKNWWNNLSEEEKKAWGKKMSELQKGKNLSEEHYKNLCDAMKKRQGKDTWMKGKNHSEESKKLISEHNWTRNPIYKDKLIEMGNKISQCWKEHGHPKGMLGKHQSEESKRKRAKYKWIYKDNEELCVHIDNVDEYINNGYKYGRLPGKIKPGNKGMKKMTNGINTVNVKPEQFDIYISNGYKFCNIRS